MKARAITLPEMFLVAGTRLAMGIGIGLLASHLLDRRDRKSLGRVLMAIGSMTTLPLAAHILHKPRLDVDN